MTAGTALERTVLAWTRTWLSVAVSGLLLLRLTVGHGAELAAALAVSALAVAAVTLLGRRRAAALRAAAGTGSVPSPTGPIASTAATISLLALAAAVLVALR